MAYSNSATMLVKQPRELLPLRFVRPCENVFERLVCERFQAVIGMFERQQASDGIGHGNAENSRALGRAYAVWRVFEGYRFIGADAQLGKHRAVRTRVGFMRLGIFETFGRVKIIEQLEPGQVAEHMIAGRAGCYADL